MGLSTSRHAWYDRRRHVALWAGILAGPLAWLTLLEVQYLLSYVACEVRQTWFLHLTTAAAATLVAAAGLAAWKAAPLRAEEPQSPPVTRATSESRASWMALCGVVLSAWFVLVILASAIPVIVLDPCQ